MDKKGLVTLVIVLLVAILTAACGGSEGATTENQAVSEAVVTEIEVTRLVEVTKEVPVEVTRLVEIEVTRIVETEKEIPVTVTPEPIPTIPPAPDVVEIEMTEMVTWPSGGDYVHIIFFASNPSADYAIDYNTFNFVMTGPDGELLDTNIDTVDIPPGGRVPVYTVMTRSGHPVEELTIEVEGDGQYIPANQYPDHRFSLSELSQPSSDKLLGYITNEGAVESSPLMKMVLIPFDEEGVPLAYVRTYTDAMAPGESTTFELSLYGDWLSQMVDYEIFYIP